jgi:prevent-host-death family protein
MREVALTKTDSDLALLVDQVARSGEAVTITRNGHPAARLEPAQKVADEAERMAARARLLEHLQRQQEDTAGRPTITWEELKEDLDRDW